VVPSRPRILIVDDEPLIREGLRFAFESEDFDVQEADGGHEAFRLLSAGAFDIVLTDVNLKGELTGGDLLERIRHQLGYGKGHLPVIVMTGDDNPDNQAALLRAGANDLVEKPIDERLLVTKLLFQLRVGRNMRARIGDVDA
jgi:CheY-like chemotaxis protein